MKKTSFLKSLLVATALCTGGSAWAFTETYAFSSMTSSDVNLTSGGEAGFTVSVPVNEVATAVTMYTITNPTLNDEVRDFSRFAVSDFKTSSSTSIGFYATSGGIRTVGNASNASDRKWGPFVFSILNLYEGDQVTIQVNATRNTKLFTVRSSNATKGGVAVAAGTNFASYNGTETYTMTADGHFDISCPDGCYVVSVTIVTEHGSETIETPDAEITGANLGARTITLTGHNTNADNATVTYYTIDGNTPTSSSTLYSEPFSVSGTDDTDEDGIVVVKAITYKNGDLTISSEVKTLNVAVGETIKLATPTITMTGMTNVNGYYYPQYTFTSISTGTYGSPSITLTSTLGGSNITSPYTAQYSGTISVVASAEGYADSDAATLLVNGNAYELANSYDFTQDSYREGLSIEGNNITISGAGVNVYRITAADFIDGLTLSTVSGPTTNFGITKAASTDSRKGITPRWGAGTITIDDWTSGSLAILTPLVSSSKIITTTGVISFGSQINYDTFTTLDIYAPATNVIGSPDCTSAYRSAFGSDIVVPNGSAKKVTFKNHGSGTGSEYYKNWVLDINYGGSLVTTVRSDWHAFGVGDFTYGYTYSSDGGATADNTNVWGTWFTDNAESDVELTLSHVDGKLYVIGTITKGSKVYYVNYAYGDGTKTEDFTMNLSVDHSWIEVESVTDASTVTTPAHPTNVAVAVGANGYATYANHVYPLDLTSAAAYKAAVAGDKVNFTLFGQAVPAGTGMLVEGTPSTTVNLPIADASTAVAGNEFLVNAPGTTFAAESGFNYFAMVKDSNPLTFGTFAPGTLAIPANKAYLKVAAGAGSRLIAVFGEETTAISEECIVKGEEFATAPVYNLSGQRVEKATKGLYIVNGKKVVVK